MRVHIIGINYWPEPTGISLVTTGRAEYLAATGHSVTIVTAPPYYPHWRVPPGYRWVTRQERAGVGILRCPLYVPARVTALRRVFHEASFIASSLLRSLFTRRPDVLIVVSPPLGLAVAAALLARIWRVPYLFDVEDLQPDAALDLGMMKPGIVTRFLYAVERLAYRQAAIVSTLTEGMRARIIAKGFPASKVQRLGLWAEPELLTLAPQAHDGELRRELGLGDAFVALHAGNMGVKQGLDLILDAARRTAHDPSLRYVLVGDGAVRRDLEGRVSAESLSNVSIIPLLPRDKFLRLLATADAALVTQQKSVADIVFPSKVITLLAAAKPVVASVNAASEVAHVINAAAAGLVVPPQDPSALARAIETLRDDPETRTAMSAAGRAYAVQHFERGTALALFAGTVLSLASRMPLEEAKASL